MAVGKELEILEMKLSVNVFLSEIHVFFTFQ